MTKNENGLCTYTELHGARNPDKKVASKKKLNTLPSRILGITLIGSCGA